MNRFYFLFPLTMLAWNFPGSGVVFAQTPLPAPGVHSADVPVPPPDDLEPSSIPSVSRTRSMINNAADVSSYWIVGTRHCPQRAKDQCDADCSFDFYHVDSDSPGHWSDSETFWKSLRSDLPICIAVHGSFASWKSVRAGSRNMNRWIRSAAPNRPLQVIFFDWPSDRRMSLLPPIDIAILGLQSGLNGLYLARLIEGLPDGAPLSLIGHSHGARTVAAAMHLLGGGSVQGYQWADSSRSDVSRSDRRIHVVLVAAAIDHDWLDPGGKYGRALSRAESILNLRNRRDIVLSAYPLRRLFSRRALARRGWTRRDRQRLGEFEDRLREIDVTELVGRGHFWSHYHSHPEIARAIAPDLFFADPKPVQLAGPTAVDDSSSDNRRSSAAARKRIDLNLMRSARRLRRPGVIGGQHGGLGDVY